MPDRFPTPLPAAFSVALLVALLAVPAQGTEYTDVVWRSMLDETVHLELDDGTEVTGELVGYEDGKAVLVKEGGEVVTLDASRVVELRRIKESAAPAPPPAPEPEPAPPAPGPATGLNPWDIPSVVADKRTFESWLDGGRLSQDDNLAMRRLRGSHVGKKGASRALQTIAGISIVASIIPIGVGCTSLQDGDPVADLGIASSICGAGFGTLGGGIGLLVGGIGLSVGAGNDMSRMRAIVTQANRAASEPTGLWLRVTPAGAGVRLEGVFH